MERLLEQIVSFMPLFGTAAVVILFLYGLHWFLMGRYPELSNERKLPRQLIFLVMSLAGAVVITLALPVSDSTRNQVIALIGVLVSGVIAFSSTTIIANFMAGIMLRTTKPFRVGDFIRVGEHFSRVAERGLFDTEVQAEHRELISLPNTYLISHPVAVVRSSGAIISATLSLGYDVHHSQVETLLIAAAEETGLDEPFFQIIELGDHAITYRVSGLLTEVKSMLTTRSNLQRMILDTLHSNEIEIVSPTFVNQRRLTDQAKILPPSLIRAPSGTSLKPEEIVFDKAEEAQEREDEKQRLRNEMQELERKAKIANRYDNQRIADLIRQKRAQLTELESPEQKSNGEEDAEQGAPADVDRPRR